MKRLFSALAMLALSCLAAAPAAAAPILIDDFLDADNMPDHSRQGYAIPLFTPANPYVAEHSEEFGTILGDERDVEIRVFSPLGFLFDAVGFFGDLDTSGPGTEGAFDFGSASSARVRAILEYDGVDPGEEATNILNNAQGLGGINLRAGGNTGFALTFRAVDPAPGETAVDLRIEVTGPGGTATWEGGIPDSATEYAFNIPYASFSSQTPFAAATSLRFIFNGAATSDIAVDFNLKSISTVPEPSSAMLASMAAVGVTVVRWRKRQSR